MKTFLTAQCLGKLFVSFEHLVNALNAEDISVVGDCLRTSLRVGDAEATLHEIC